MIASPGRIRDAPSPRRRWLEVIVLAAVLVAFGLVGGEIGIAAALLTVVIWYVSGVPYAIGVATVCLVVLVPESEFGPAVVGIVTPLALFVIAAAVSWGGSVRVVAASAVAPLALGGLAWAGIRWGPLWLAGIVLLGAIGFVGYALHRLTLAELVLSDSIRGDLTKTGRGDHGSISTEKL